MKFGQGYLQVKVYEGLAREARLRWGTGRHWTSGTAIVMQGPIVKHFTLETLKYYRRLFPSVSLILATWKDQYSADLASRLTELRVDALWLEKPQTGGPFNQNLQMVSACKGLELAKKLGCSHALKTRTDQRFFEPSFLDRFALSSESLPLPLARKNQFERIVGVSRNTFLYRVYGLSDMALWGDVRDLLEFFDGTMVGARSLDSREASSENNVYVCETFFVSNFLKKTGWKVDGTLNDWWSAMRDCFTLVDAESVGLYWFKYSAFSNLQDHLRGPGKFTEIDSALLEFIRQGRIVPSEESRDYVEELRG